MLKPPLLSDKDLNAFQSDGFVILRGGFNSAAMEKIDAWTRETEAMPEESGQHWVYHEKSLKEPGKDLISRIENLAPFHQGFRQLSDSLKAPVAQLLREEAVLFKEKVNFKMAGGDGFKPHQDSQAGWDTYADYFISVLVGIDPATEENGCLKIVKGHHQRGLFKSWEPLTDEDMADMDFVSCPTEPGDIVMFDSYAPHGSDPNMSDRTRRLYYATYNRQSDGDHMAQYYADKHKSFPPDIDRDPEKEYVFRV